ncbi:hypothetical protein Leryth_008763 [Lithospermum erythrorhizon]|nr:hypothetical protein Leryth_008763 [Lithospermum erythrorhizon]
MKKKSKISQSCVKKENEFSTNLEMEADSRRPKFKAIASFDARYDQVKKMKVTSKKRTKAYSVSSGSQIVSSCKKVDDRVSPSGSGSSSAVSCLTNSSGFEFSVQSTVGLGKAKSSPNMKMDKVIKGDTSNKIGSGHIRRRADGILKMLATYDKASEVRIREVLGDSPDTSKALRILLRRAQVTRQGVGGRGDPYTYSIA